MLTFIILIFAVALIVYTLLGGADFGAGIVESFIGKKGKDTIAKSIAPIWEANHVWLVLAVVVLFNAFPEAYSTISIHLYIPLMVVLTGIILRGAFFTFRYYDTAKENTMKTYTFLFRFSSYLASMFLGITLGAFALGFIPSGNSGLSFNEGYIKPWFNIFSFSVGFFIVFLFGLLAGIYLIGEANDFEEKGSFIKISRTLMILLTLSGIFVFIAARINGLKLFGMMTSGFLGILVVVLVIATIIYGYFNLHKTKSYVLRLMAGFLVVLFFGGYVLATFPVIVNMKVSDPLTFFNAAAPPATLRQLTYALIVGVLIIIPSVIYLFKVYKYKKESSFK